MSEKNEKDRSHKVIFRICSMGNVAWNIKHCWEIQYKTTGTIGTIREISFGTLT